jgi:hypothetical protein
VSEYEQLVECRSVYLIIGDIDKTFHRPECECFWCEDWRRTKGRPTHAELRAMPKEEV